MANILLVLPPYPKSDRGTRSMKRAETSAPPLGLAYLSSFLERHGYEAVIEDFRLHDPRGDGVLSDTELRDTTMRLIKEYEPRVVGVSTKTQIYPNAKKMLGFIKSKYNIPVIAGGIHSTFLPEEALDDGFDIVVRREGEETIKEVLDALYDNKPLEDVLGISFRDGSDVKHNPDRPFMVDLDSLPFPARDKLRLNKYIQRGAMVTSRGCPVNCNFCSCGAFANHTYRERGLDNVVQEMEEMRSGYGIKEFFFHDDTFTLHPERTTEFCERVLRERFDIYWGCQARADTMTRELAELMFRAGCRAIQYGVESGNNDILRSISKGITTGHVEKVVKITLEAGIPHITCSFIIGHPEDTEDTIIDTVNFARHLLEVGATYTPLSLLTPFPGTDIYVNAEKYGLEISLDSWENISFARAHIGTRHLTRERLEGLYNIALGAVLDKQDEVRARKLR